MADLADTEQVWSVGGLVSRGVGNSGGQGGEDLAGVLCQTWQTQSVHGQL